MLLEICANSYKSALNAEKSGAYRVELCSELSVGGITPSYGLLKEVATKITIPVNVLIRPRSGNFYYSEAEFEQIKQDILICKKLGFNGIVSGILNVDNSIDINRTKEIIELSKPLSFTFHRAFDCVINPQKSLKELMDLKVDRILTSGLQEKAINGIDLLIELQKIAGEKLTILPGSGINADNAKKFKEVGFKEIHTSASKIINSDKSIFFGNVVQTASNIEEIQRILKVIQ